MTLTFPKRGLVFDDYDFEAMVQYTNPPYKLEDIHSVECLKVGERDESDWAWIVHMKDKRELITVAGCDYTGWDCQAGSRTGELK